MRPAPRGLWKRSASAVLKIANFGVLALLLTALVVGQGTKDTTDIVTGIQQRKIQVKVNGDGIERINVEVSRRAGSPPTIVRIPTGTLFASGSGSVQSMVATEPATADLSSTLSTVISVAVACANMHLGVPDSDDTFTVQRAPNQAELQTVLPVIARANPEYAVRQAAVWIITDDADYDDLGTLVSGFGGFGGSREINHP